MDLHMVVDRLKEKVFFFTGFGSVLHALQRNADRRPWIYTRFTDK